MNNGDRLATFCRRLAEYGFGPCADAFDAADDDKGTIGDMESSRDRRREANVFQAIDEVDREVVA